MRPSTKRAPNGIGFPAFAFVPPSGRTNDKEVVVMSQTFLTSQSRGQMVPRLFALLLAAHGLAGCAAVSQDVDAYYRQMAYNYNEAKEKAKMDALTLEGQSNALAASGDYAKYRRTQRELDRIKSWEAKCEKQANRFKKAAEWTEAHLHVSRPPIPDAPPGFGPQSDQAVHQASGVKDP
jgi:hypothetical protein